MNRQRARRNAFSAVAHRLAAGAPAFCRLGTFAASKPYLFSGGARKETAETRWPQRMERRRERSNRSPFSDLASGGAKCSSSAFIASLRFISPSCNPMIAPKVVPRAEAARLPSLHRCTMNAGNIRRAEGRRPC